MTELVAIAAEPTGVTYVQLLQFALDSRSLFSLTWREQLTFSPAAGSIAAVLHRDIVSESQTDAWPGTKLLGHRATVRTYRLTPASLSILARTRRLYAWNSPDRPEDLAFYAAPETPWLGSITHERDSFLLPDAVNIQVLIGAVPGLRLSDSARPDAG